MRWSAWLVLLVAVAAGGVLASTSSACACGMALQADVVRERALVIQHGAGGRASREEIIASFDLTVDAGGTAAVILPVPGDPTVEAVQGDPLGYLDEVTAPSPGDADDGTAGAVGGAPGAGVDVIGRQTVGGYDVSRLRADDPQALGRWLDDNGYETPPGAQPILAEYVRRGWRYVAIRLAKGQQGALKPLRVAFPTPSLVYPMRLSRLATKPVSVTLYVLADREQQVPILSTTFTRRLADLDPQPPAELRPLFPEGSQLTKFVGTAVSPSEFTRDLVITPAAAASSAPGLGRAGDADGVAWWIVVLGVVVLVGGAVAVGRRPPA